MSSDSSDVDVCSIGTGAAAVITAVAVIFPAISAGTAVAAPAAVVATPAVVTTPTLVATPTVVATQGVPTTPGVIAAPAAAGAPGPIPAAIGVSNAFAIGVGASTSILFTMDQVTGIQDFPGCREASIESCARVDLNFDAFDRTINVFGTPMERNFESDLDANTKFFEVVITIITLIFFI